MSKVITFSLTFQKTHPRASESTYFVEKLFTSLCEINTSDDLMWKLISNLIFVYSVDTAILDSCWPKNHTIRSDHRFKVGEFFSPRAWSGKPYKSKQIILAQDIEIKKIWNFKINRAGEFFVNDILHDITTSYLPENDGLSQEDFLNWFPANKEFDGQLICWNYEMEY